MGHLLAYLRTRHFQQDAIVIHVYVERNVEQAQLRESQCLEDERDPVNPTPKGIGQSGLLNASKGLYVPLFGLEINGLRLTSIVLHCGAVRLTSSMIDSLFSYCRCFQWNR